VKVSLWGRGHETGEPHRGVRIQKRSEQKPMRRRERRIWGEKKKKGHGSRDHPHQKVSSEGGHTSKRGLW